MDLLRGAQKFFLEAEKRGASPRLRSSRGFSGGMSGPSPGIVSSSRGLLPRVPATLGVATGGALNIMARGAVIPSIIETAQSVFNPSDNIVTALGDLGTAVHNQFAPPEQRKLYNPIPRNDPRNARIIRERDSARGASRPEGSMATLGGNPVQWMDNRWVPFQTEGEMARQEQARIQAKAPPAIQLPSSTSVPAGTIAQQAEAQERSRIAQMTEQDPLFKKYRVADLTKAYNTATTPEEKERIGLEIWATTNPQLAQRLKPGQVGYSEATSAFMSQSPLGQFQAQTGDMQYANKMAGPMEGVAAVNPFGQQALQMPLTGIQVPPTNRIGTAESFASYSPIPGAMQAFTDPMKFVTPEDTSEVQKALIKQAFASRIK